MLKNLQWMLPVGIALIFGCMPVASAKTRMESIIVHANVVWNLTDVVVQENTILKWEVEREDTWSFNPELFPEGHSADGIPVKALRGYVYPDQPIGKLIGKIGDCGRIFPMGTSGYINILPSEDGEFLYLTMNDDIIGQYGNGFKDNEGEIVVKITRMRNK